MGASHALDLIRVLYSLGYTFEDLLTAYPGRDINYVERVMTDNAHLLNRNVMPYGLLGIRSCSSAYCNISEHGFRRGVRAQEWPPPKDKRILFCFGGSTMLGFCVEDRDTIPSYLQQEFDRLGENTEVYNFGSGSYTSRHEVLLYMNLLDHGFIPDEVLFLDGFNDCYFLPGNRELITVFDFLYMREKRKWRSSAAKRVLMMIHDFFDKRLLRYKASDHHEYPEVIALGRELMSDGGIRSALDSSAPGGMLKVPSETSTFLGNRLWSRYLTSQTLIRALSERFGVKTNFFWQPVPYFYTEPSQRIVEKIYTIYRQNVFSAVIYRWLEENKFPNAGTRFFDLSKEGVSRKEVLYIDHGHYTASFAEHLAKRICESLMQ